MLTLKLTTPLMGSNVKSVAHSEILALQKELKKHGYFKGPIDGVYGPLTAQAVYRAKFYLGYAKPDNTNADSFWKLLTGTAKPTTAQVKLAAKRKREAAAKAAATPIGAKALKYLIQRTGLKEHPAGSNRCEVSVWYGLIGPWCAMTGMWAYEHVGSKVFNKANGKRYGWAYVPNIVHDARNGAHGLVLTHDPKPGCGIAYDWTHNGVADHWGTFEKWISRNKGTFYAREGNTAVGNDSNGGQLMRRARTLTQVQAFIKTGG